MPEFNEDTFKYSEVLSEDSIDANELLSELENKIRSYYTQGNCDQNLLPQIFLIKSDIEAYTS